MIIELHKTEEPVYIVNETIPEVMKMINDLEQSYIIRL